MELPPAPAKGQRGVGRTRGRRPAVGRRERAAGRLGTYSVPGRECQGSVSSPPYPEKRGTQERGESGRNSVTLPPGWVASLLPHFFIYLLFFFEKKSFALPGFLSVGSVLVVAWVQHFNPFSGFAQR